MSDIMKFDSNENFRRALHFTFGNEGGYSNDPDDPGGRTMMGITESTLLRAYQQQIVGHHDIKKLTRGEAEAVYGCLYWAPSRAQLMPWALCALHFDAAVNNGIGGAGRLLQRALNSLYNAELVLDGSAGPATMRKMREVLGWSDGAAQLRRIESEYCNQREQLFRAIVKKDSNKSVFLHGWLNRIARNRQLIEE